MIWHTHIIPAAPKQTAIIAVYCKDDGAPYLLPEIYVWSEQHGCWITESTGLKLKHTEYWWIAETDVLETLPS